MKMVVRNKVFILLFTVVFVSTACQTKIMPVDSEKSSAALINNEYDYQFVFRRLENQIKLAPNRVKNIELDAYLTRLTCEISVEYCTQIRVYVINQPNFNAHMLPTGALIVFTGLLLRINNQEQLVYVLAHEIAHYVYKHGVKKINHAKMANRSLNTVYQGNPLKFFNRLDNVTTKNKYSRELEREADLFSINYFMKNNLSLTKAVSLFKNFHQENSAAGKYNRGGYLSSHPGIQQRINLISKHAAAVSVNKTSNQDSWPILKEEFINDWLIAELHKREFDSTLVLLKQLQAGSPNPGHYDFYFGEIYRKQGGSQNLQTAMGYYKNHLKSKSIIVSSVYKSLAQVYAELENSAAAKQFYQKYINLNPKAADLGIIQQELKNLSL